MAYNVLIVDDSSTARSVIGKTLSISGVDLGKVFTAANGQEALDILGKEWVDIVFADINMPVMNGIEMISKMEADGLLKSVPVVVVSTEGSSTRIESLIGKGVKGYIRKPFSPEKIKQIFLELLGGGEGK